MYKLLNALLLVLLLISVSPKNILKRPTAVEDNSEQAQITLTSLHRAPEIETFNKEFDLRDLTLMPKKTVKTESCNIVNCAYPYGNCSDNNTCICYPGYVDVSELFHIRRLNHISRGYCSYSQKYQIVAFLLEFMFPFGFGHLYLNRVMIGLLKMMFAFVAFSIYNNMLNDNYWKHSFQAYAGLFIISLFLVLHFYDITMLGLNKFTDGNGIPVKQF